MTARSNTDSTRLPPLREDLNELTGEISSTVDQGRGTPQQRTIAIFDMAASTEQKVVDGQRQAIAHIVSHNLLCRRLTTAYNGRVIKELGDGVLCVFGNPVEACLTALNIKAASRGLAGVGTKGAITTGTVQELAAGTSDDVLGEPVDRCARVLGLALPDQMLIDQATRDSAHTWLADYDRVILNGPFQVELKGCGSVGLFEISLQGESVGDLRVPFRVEPTGRLSVTEKDRFLLAAKESIVELGIGLTTFTAYLRATRPDERRFAEHIGEALARGVNVGCYALNPRSAIAREYARDRGETDYLNAISQALDELTAWGKSRASARPGSFEVRVYDHFPYLYAMCIDPDSDRARIIVSQYLYATARADTPYVQLSRTENPMLFDKWWNSVQALIADARLWRGQR